MLVGVDGRRRAPRRLVLGQGRLGLWALGVGWDLVPARGGSGRGWCERFEAFERGEELGDPWPGALEMQLCAAAGECEAPGDVQQLVAQSFGLGFGELA